MIKLKQESFDGGMNQLSPDTRLADNAYRLLINGRVRYGEVEPIQDNEELTAAPAGLKQGLIGVGNVLVAFIAGKAYYKLDDTTAWQTISGFSMSTTAERVWTLAVPASTFNFLRKLDTSANRQVIAVVPDFTVSGTPSGILVQDGINQPWIIFHDSTTNTFVARETKKYADWSNTSTVSDDREYVPIGRQMFMLNEKVYIVAPDQKSLYQSVSGRPLDFMVNIDADGNKLPSETQGGAASTSFSFDYKPITCVANIDIEDAFVYATESALRIISLDYTDTLFGEPKYREIAKINAGVVNQFSFVEILGDYAFVDAEVVKSFNAVRQTKWEGRNALFSKMLARATRGIKQTSPQVTTFNDYALFHIQTIYGYATAVYDMLAAQWVGFDITTVNRVKQFATTVTTSENKLFAITEDNKIFQMYSSAIPAVVQLHTKAFTAAADNVEIKSNTLIPFFDRSTTSTTLMTVEYVDSILGQRVIDTIPSKLAGVRYPVRPPVGPSNKHSTQNSTVVFRGGNVGKKIAYVLQWNTDAKLQSFTLNLEEFKRGASTKQVNAAYA